MQRKQVIMRAALTGSVSALMLAVAACGTDRTTAPGVATSATGVRASSVSKEATTSVQTLTVFPNRATSLWINGVHKLYFSAGAVCDPATSGYGPDTWETPCEPLHGKLEITVESSVDSAGHPFVRFSPELRFTPDDSKPVWLSLSDKKAAHSTEPFRIVYCPSDGSACVDESLTDPEVTTQIDAKKQFLSRRLKHFSGYNIASGTLEVTAAQ